MNDPTASQNPEPQGPELAKAKSKSARRTLSANSDDIAGAIISVVNAFQAGPLARKGKLYPSTFDVNEEKVKQLQDRAMEVLTDAKIQWFPNSAVDFRASVGMPDLTRREFSDFTNFMSKGGDEPKLERLELCWSRRVMEPFAAQVSIEVAFITERRLDVGELGLFDYHTSSMSLNVNGHFDSFVERVFSLFDPILIASKISIIYAPLLVFRNRLVVQIISQALSLGMMLVIQSKSIQYLNAVGNLDKAKIVQEILANHDVGQKIDLVARQLITPEDSPWWYIIAALGAGAVGFAAMYAAAMIGFPLLIPRSLINIGLLKTFNEKYQNAYKLVVVTIIFGMIIWPVIKKAFELILH